MTQVFELDTVDNESIAAEMADLIGQAEERAKAGDVVGEVEGVTIKKAKTRTMVHMNGVELPERTRVYDRRGYPSDVPTAQLAYHLSKKTLGGERAFFSRPPDGVVMPVPLDVECEWCTKRAGRKTKVFYDMDDYENHCEDKHPQEYGRKQRRETQSTSVSSVAGILKLLANLSPEQRAELIGEK